MTWKGIPLKEAERELPKSRVEAAGVYSEIITALGVGKMPHEWAYIPRWSRLVTMAALSIQQKIEALTLQAENK